VRPTTRLCLASILIAGKKDHRLVYSSSVIAVGTPLDCIPGDGGICVAFSEDATLSASGLTLSVTEDAGAEYLGTAFNGVQFAGLTLSDGSSITGVTLDTNLPGLNASDVSFTSNSVEYNAQGDSFLDAAYFVTLNLTTGTASNVPEPFTLSLFGAGLAGAAAMRRRKKAKV
jgi:hypothetical protein